MIISDITKNESNQVNWISKLLLRSELFIKFNNGFFIIHYVCTLCPIGVYYSK